MEMNIVISYVSSEKSELDYFWKKNRSSEGLRLGSNINKPNLEAGIIEIVDILSGKVLISKNIDKPMAILFDKKSDNILYSNSLNELVILNKNLVEVDRLKLPLFNSIHSISKFKDGFLLSSTGIDALVWLDLNNKKSSVIWKACDYDYNYFPDNSFRVLDYGADHSTVTYPTLQQATHINSGEFFNNGKNIIATLFHQGRLINIDLEAKKAVTVIDNLYAPHGAHVYLKNGKEFAMCSDTKNNQVLLDISLNAEDQKNGYAYRILKDNFSWVQNARLIDENKIFVLDANNNRIGIYNYDDLSLIKKYNFDKERRIFDVCKI